MNLLPFLLPKNVSMGIITYIGISILDKELLLLLHTLLSWPEKKNKKTYLLNSNFDNSILQTWPEVWTETNCRLFFFRFSFRGDISNKLIFTNLSTSGSLSTAKNGSVWLYSSVRPNPETELDTGSSWQSIHESTIPSMCTMWFWFKPDPTESSDSATGWPVALTWIGWWRWPWPVLWPDFEGSSMCSFLITSR